MSENATQAIEDAALWDGGAVANPMDPDTLDSLRQRRQMEMLSQAHADAARQSQTNPSLQDYVLMSHGLQALPPIQNED